MIFKVRPTIFFISGIIFFLFLITSVSAQDNTVLEIQNKKDRYIYSDENKLQIMVHIWGEVNRPGQYIVPDGTNVLELISLAGGPTEYSNLGNIKLTREVMSNSNNTNKVQKEIIKIDLKNYLSKEYSNQIPVLQPGNVVKISKNNWFRYQTVIRLISQAAIIVQALYFYSRID